MTNLFSNINIFSENDYEVAIESSLKSGQKKVLFYLNSQVLFETSKSPDIETSILSSDYLIADGYSIVWAYKKLLDKKIEKVVFTYSYYKFIRTYFIENNISVFFLGASEINLLKAIEYENANFPNLKIVGYHHGYFNKKLESNVVIQKINKSEAKVLIVGMGCPIAEQWIIKNKKRLNPTLIFSVGGFFDFLARDKNSAPKWMYNSGLEWVFRLGQEPRRLFTRYLVANTYLIYSIFKNILINEKK